MSMISFYDFEYSIEKEMEEKQQVQKEEKPEPKKEEKPSKEKDLSHRVEQKNKNGGKNVFDYLNEAKSKASTITKKFQLWTRQRKNLSFYKKYLDRVQSGLYERFASQAIVTENDMVDDPVQILKGSAQNYIRSLVKNINSLYETVTKMAKDLESKPSVDSAIPVIQSYCKDILDQKISGKRIDENKLTWKEKLINATRYKIAKILLSNRDTGVYGYTPRNIVLKKYPTPNHLIVTLFVKDPEMKPHEQNVSDIFKSPESFEILADSDKQDVFNIANMTEAILNKTVNNKVLNEIKENKNICLTKFKNANIEDKKDQGKILDSIWDGLNASCKELLSRKAYLIDCINIYFDMILRIDELGIKCIKEMLNVEESVNDDRYNKSSKLNHFKDKNNRYSDGDSRSPDEKRQRYRNINEIAKKLNKS